MDTAKELGKLDELTAKVEGMKPEAGDDAAASERGGVALRVLIQIARSDDDAAARVLEAIPPILDKLPLDEPEWSRWSELVVADRAAGRPTLRRRALAIAEALAVRAGKKPPTEADKRAPSKLWEDQVKNLRAAGLPVDRGRSGRDLEPRRPALGPGHPDAGPDARHRRTDPPLDRARWRSSRTSLAMPTI